MSAHLGFQVVQEIKVQAQSQSLKLREIFEVNHYYILYLLWVVSHDHTHRMDYLSKEFKFSIRVIGNECVYLWCCEPFCWTVPNSDSVKPFNLYQLKNKQKENRIHSSQPWQILYFSAISRQKYEVTVLCMFKICGWREKQNFLWCRKISSLEIQLPWKLCPGQNSWKVQMVT